MVRWQGRQGNVTGVTKSEVVVARRRNRDHATPRVNVGHGAAVVAIALIAVGCGGGSSGSPATTSSGTTSSSASAPAGSSSTSTAGSACVLATATEAAHLLGVGTVNTQASDATQCFYQDAGGTNSLLMINVSSPVTDAAFAAHRGSGGEKIANLGDDAFVQLFQGSPSSGAVFVLVGSTEIDFTAQSAKVTIERTPLEALASVAVGRR